MRVRVLVLAAFAVMAVVPMYIAWTTRVVPGPTQAAAGAAASGGSVSIVTPLVWPKEPLGLATTGSSVLWEQLSADGPGVSLWSYEIAGGQSWLLLPRSQVGSAAGPASAAGHLVAWSTSAGKTARSVQAYDLDSTRRWQVAGAGLLPTTAGDTVVWVDRSTVGGDVIRSSNALTDATAAITTRGHVRALAAWGPWAVWSSGSGRSGEVWAGSFRDGTRYRLAARGTAVAIDRDRVLWAAARGHSTAIVSWDRSSSTSTILCRLPGSASSLALAGDYAAWVMTRDGASQVWSYDFARGKASVVDATGGRQATPVIAGSTVYWAGDQDGTWNLYSRRLDR